MVLICYPDTMRFSLSECETQKSFFWVQQILEPGNWIKITWTTADALPTPFDLVIFDSLVLMLLTKRNVNLTWSSKIQMSCWETWIPTTGPSCPALMTWNFTYRPVQSTSMCGQLCFASDFFYEDTCIYLTTWLRIDLYASILNMKNLQTKHRTLLSPCDQI
jgi:hypothetical protein